jgi:hypothetical protein
MLANNLASPPDSLCKVTEDLPSFCLDEPLLHTLVSSVREEVVQLTQECLVVGADHQIVVAVLHVKLLQLADGDGCLVTIMMDLVDFVSREIVKSFGEFPSERVP